MIKIQWLAPIWCQKHQNNVKLHKWSKYNDLHRFDVETIKATQNSKRDQITMNLHRFDVQTIENVELRRKTFKTTQNYISDQNTMTCTDLMWKTSKQHKTTKIIKLHELHRFYVQTIKHNAKLQKRSNYDELHAFDIKTNENVVLGQKPFKTTQNYKSDQNTMTCIDMMSKVIKLRWICTDLTSKRSKMSRFVAKHSKQRKTT